ncbi:MAG: glucose-1-phosphate adenylyltransferase [Succinivibrionaceae bacterium]
MTSSLTARQATNKTMAIVLAGGRGSRLRQLTDTRAKPATYFGGKYRIIDFVLSNCVNSGIRKIGVVTQYKSHSLLRHIQAGWSFMRNQFNEFLDLLPAQQRIDEVHWYRGTADAIFQNIDIIKDHHPKFILILAGDHIYKMDYAKLILDHLNNPGHVTISCVPISKADAGSYGIMSVNEDGKIVNFVEKPQDPSLIPGDGDTCLASMGIYVFDAKILYKILSEDEEMVDSQHDFGNDIIPNLVRKGLAYAHDFSKSCVCNRAKNQIYWRDVGTIDSFWAANMDLASVTPDLDIYDQDWPIWTYQTQLPAAKYVQDINGASSILRNSEIAAGVIISGSSICSSVLFYNVRVHSFCFINEVVAFPDCIIHRGCRLTRVVIDRGCELPRNLVVGENYEEDVRRFYRSEGGVTLITRRMLHNLREREPWLFDGFDSYSQNKLI